MKKKINNEFISNTEAVDNYRKGWKLTLKEFWPLLGVVAIIFIIDALSDMLGSNELFGLGGKIISVIWGFLIIGPIQMSSSWVFLKAVRKEKFKIGDMFSVFERNYWNAVGASFLTFVFVILGLILFIVPGIFFAVRLAFVPYLIIDKKMKAVEAVETSWSMTKGYSWTIFGMFLLAILLVIAGVIALGVGILFSIVWISSAFAVLYHSVSVKKF